MLNLKIIIKSFSKLRMSNPSTQKDEAEIRVQDQHRLCSEALFQKEEKKVFLELIRINFECHFILREKGHVSQFESILQNKYSVREVYKPYLSDILVVA